MAKFKKRPVIPIYAIALVWVIFTLVHPLYRVSDYVTVILLSAVVFIVAKGIFPTISYEMPDPQPQAAPSASEEEPPAQDAAQEAQEEAPSSTGDPKIDALIQEKVEYKNLGLVITDEQHRFGVRQREALTTRGNPPHVLVMSATPIPRTLAIILYGDLDISIIDELPAKRLPIKNCVVGTSYRPKAYSFIEKQVQMGRQAYVICPMVEESEGLDAENVLDYTRKLKGIFPSDINVSFLHGKMKPKEKNEIMEAFSENRIQVLVSTTVVEVGVNVPNATVMMVENAERFGLAQLHQLRGRVGRGQWQSYCIFIHGKNQAEKSKQFLSLFEFSFRPTVHPVSPPRLRKTVCHRPGPGRDVRM